MSGDTLTKRMACAGGCGASELVDPSAEPLVCARCQSGTDPHPDRKPWEERNANDAPASLRGSDAQVWAEGYNAAVSTLGDTYVVAWTGGYDQPSFFSSCSEVEALAKFREWESDCKSGDRVDLLRIGLDGKTEVVLSDDNDSDDD